MGSRNKLHTLNDPPNFCFTYVQCFAGMPECSWWQPTNWGGAQESCRPAFKAACHHWQWEQASPQDGSLCWTSGSVAECWGSHLLTRSSEAQGIIKCVMKQGGCPCLAQHCVTEHGNCSPHIIDDVAKFNLGRARDTDILAVLELFSSAACMQEPHTQHSKWNDRPQ